MPRLRRDALHLTGQALTLLLTVVLIHSVWRATGARLAIMAEAALLVVLVANLVWSALVVRRVRASILDVPVDAVAGDDVTCAIDVAGTRTPLTIRMLSSPRAPQHRVVPPERGGLLAAVGRRGVATAAILEITCTAPLGLIGVRRRVVAALPHALHVAPRPAPAREVRLPERGAPTMLDEDLRGTRSWTPGDPLRRVHWPTVARTGTLSVREYEPPRAPTVRVAVDLGAGGAPGEDVASRASWVAQEALRRGHHVVLVTVDDGAVVAGPVRSALEVGRRLSAAGPGATPPSGHGGAEEIEVVIDAAGERWR